MAFLVTNNGTLFDFSCHIKLSSLAISMIARMDSIQTNLSASRSRVGIGQSPVSPLSSDGLLSGKCST